MREVARAAGVARSTLYRYFPSRDDVLVVVIKQEIHRRCIASIERLELGKWLDEVIDQ